MVLSTGTFLSEFVLPLAVAVSAAATTTTAVVAVRLLHSVRTHERALFGAEEIDGHDGIVTAVNDNTERSDTNRRVLRAHDMVPPAYEDAYWGEDPEEAQP